jgi:hypothetical protein
MIPAAKGQLFFGAMAGTAALSSAAAAPPNPPRASNYDPKLGPALNLEAGYDFDDWFSVQAGYLWNRNRIVSTEVRVETFAQRIKDEDQSALAANFMVYFRPRSSRVRPYLAAGPAWVRVAGGNKLGLRVPVGLDVMMRPGWYFRYSFSEMITGSGFGATLSPPAAGKFMNFQNLFGFVKRF